MTSAEIRQSFLDFFKSKQHTIVPSSSLMPDSPNLLFTNAGMNQFVPIFLGQTECRRTNPPRAADTQKCIRAGGKHNDLEDVGLDTYHHTFFEMLGNWSFGDYFKKEAIDWAWELVDQASGGFPPERLYATVYKPGTERTERVRPGSARSLGAALQSRRARSRSPHRHRQQEGQFLDDGRHRPVRPVHRDPRRPHARQATRAARWSTPATRGASRSGTSSSSSSTRTRTAPSRRCPRSTSTPAWASSASPRSSRARKTSRISPASISNYETDIFRPIFDELEKLSGKSTARRCPKPGNAGHTEQDNNRHRLSRHRRPHPHCLSFAIADGILPSNEGRGYVLRRILRRAVRYGRSLGFHEPFFYQLVDVLAETMGDVFPEIRESQAHIKETLKREEESFNQTLDKGIALFEAEVARLHEPPPTASGDFRVARASRVLAEASRRELCIPARATPNAAFRIFELPWAIYALTVSTARAPRPLVPGPALSLLDSFPSIFTGHATIFSRLASCLIMSTRFSGRDQRGWTQRGIRSSGR